MQDCAVACRIRAVGHYVSDPLVRSFWMNEYAAYSNSFRTEAICPIQNKIGKALIDCYCSKRDGLFNYAPPRKEGMANPLIVMLVVVAALAVLPAWLCGSILRKQQKKMPSGRIWIGYGVGSARKRSYG